MHRGMNLHPSTKSLYRRKVEQGYSNRPANDPPVVVVPTPNPFLNFIHEFLGIA